MYRGYFPLWRRFKEHPFWTEKRKFSKAEAWIDIITEAQHQEEPTDVMLGMTMVKKYQGDCLFSIRTWAMRWGWSDSAVRRFFAVLSTLNMIVTKSESKTTRLTVLNYKEYNTPVTSKRRASDEQTASKRRQLKNVKKEKNDNKKPIYPDWLNLDLWTEFKRHRVRLKKPLTPHAEKLNITKLEKLMSSNGATQDKIINQTIARGWQGFFPVKESGLPANTNVNPRPTTYAQHQDAEMRDEAQRIIDRMEGKNGKTTVIR